MIKQAMAKPNIANELGSGTSIGGSANTKHGVNNRITANPTKFLFIHISFWLFWLFWQLYLSTFNTA
jgi:hypothetical protein